MKRKKQELKTESGTYPKSAHPKITPKETLTYTMRYMAQFLPDVTSDIASHKSSSAD